MNHADATAAPVHATLAGKSYRLSPLKDRDLGELVRHAQVRAIEEARRQFKHVCQEIARFGISSPQVRQFLNSDEGVAWVTWLSMQDHHSDVPFEHVEQMVLDPKVKPDLLDKIDDVNGLHTLAADDADDAKKNSSQSTTGRTT